MTPLKGTVTRGVNYLLANNESYKTIGSVFVSDEIRSLQVNGSNSDTRETKK